MYNNPNQLAHVRRMLGNPARQLNYNQVYKMWGYPLETLPYAQLNRMLRNPAIKHPYNQIPMLIRQKQIAEKQRQEIRNSQGLPINNDKRAKHPPHLTPYQQHQQQMEAIARAKEAQAKQQFEEKQQHTTSPDEQKKEKEKQKKKEQQNKTKQPKKAMISFDKLSVGTISSSSGVFNGKNIQFGWSSHSKTNTGFGTLGGHNNRVNRNTNVVFDNDQVDTPIDDRDTMWSPVPTA